MAEDRRPTPEQLLAQIHAQDEKEEKKRYGKLKIFLGFAAGTGKTYAMLEAAHELKNHGVDVVAGYIEPHARPETSALLEGLEQIPFKMIPYKGVQLREFDLDAAIERRPQVLLVDELAHSNASECRHKKRYEDIEELLNKGINVYTTVNIQHLESLNDIVGTITGTVVRETVPDSIFDRADQVKLVDIEADELIERMKEGKIYSEVQAQRALHNFFTRDKLIAQREIALRRMADRVNHLAEQEKIAMGAGDYSTGEHVLTCISASPSSARVIRTASRLAYAFHAEFTALYVETRKLQNMDEKGKKRRDENIRLARTLGAKIVTVYGEDVPQQIAEYAKVSNVTKIVLGKTRHRILFGQTRGSLVDNVSQYLKNIDIYIIPDISNRDSGKENIVQRFSRRAHPHISGTDLLKMAASMTVCTLLGYWFMEIGLREANIIMVYLLGVMATALFTRGYISSILASLSSVLLFNFFFTEPHFTFDAAGSDYPFTFIMMFTVGWLSSYLMNKIQKQSERNAKRAYRTEILLTSSRRLRRTMTREAVGVEIASQIQKLMDFTVIVYLKQNDKIQEPLIYFRKGIPQSEEHELEREYRSLNEKAVAEWVFNNAHRAGCTTHTLPNAKAIYLPVMDGEIVHAVIGMVLEERREIDTFSYALITAMLDEAALVFDRIGRIEKLKHEELHEQIHYEEQS